MNTTHKGLTLLLRSAVTGEALSLPEDFHMGDADGLIRSQSLLPLVYQGAYRCGISPKTELMQQYQLQYYRNLISSENQLRAIDQIFKAFEENGIDYLPLKGCNLKKLYPQPEMRIMGDADILIRLEQYEKIRSLMQSLGYAEVKESAYDFCWNRKDLYVELHKSLFSASQTDLCRYFGNGWKKAAVTEGHRYDFSREDEFAYIFSHMAKHFRFCGIGARQITDLYVYRKSHPELDETRLEQIMARLRLLEFYRNIRRLLAVWFEGAPEDAVTDCITAFLFSAGNWGTMENKLYAQELLKAHRTGAVHNSQAKSFWNALFPPMRDMQLSYNILYKYPFLCPVFWVVRWFDVLIHRRRNIGRKFGIIRDMTDEKILAHQQLMRSMGLEFDYADGDDD